MYETNERIEIESTKQVNEGGNTLTPQFLLQNPLGF